MPEHAPAALRRIALAALLSFSLLAAGCSDEANDTTTEPASGDASEWCATVRRSQNVVASQVVDSLREQAEAAPDALAADYDATIEMLDYQAANPGDAAGIKARGVAVRPSFGRILAAIADECGIVVSFG